MMNDAPYSRLETHSREGQPPYYMKLINVHDVKVSISAFVCNAMPLKEYLEYFI